MALEDKLIMAIGRNRSGVYSGELDYTIYSSHFEELSSKDVAEVARLLESLSRKCYAGMFEAGLKTPLHYRIHRWIDLNYFPLFSKVHRNWPIELGWQKRFKVSPPYISAHGWQIGWKDGERIYGWTLSIGRFQIRFGKDKNV